MRRRFVTPQQQKHNVLNINPFCHDFCLRKTKISPKLSSFLTFDPVLKHWAIDSAPGEVPKSGVVTRTAKWEVL